MSAPPSETPSGSMEWQASPSMPGSATIPPGDFQPPSVTETAAAPPPPAEKPKAKKRKKNEPGPGKAWRKGLKGYGDQMPGEGGTTTMVPKSKSAAKRTSTFVDIDGAPVSATLLAPGARGTTLPKQAGGTIFLPSQPLDLRMPPTRKWEKAPMMLQTIGGKTISLATWRGEPESAFAVAKVEKEARLAQEAAEAAARKAAEEEAAALAASQPPTPSLGMQSPQLPAGLAIPNYPAHPGAMMAATTYHTPTQPTA